MTWKNRGVWALKWLLRIALSLAVIAGIVVGGYYLVLYRGLVGALIIFSMFFFGVVITPILAYAPLGRVGGELLGNPLLLLAFLGRGRTVLNLRTDGTYEIVSADKESLIDEDTFWGRFKGVPFGVTYDRESEAFGDYVDNLDDKYDAQVLADGGVDDITGARGNVREFLEFDPDHDGFWLAWAEKLHELKESASIGLGFEAKAAALYKDGGDSHQYSPWAVLGGSAFFYIVSALLALVLLT